MLIWMQAPHYRAIYVFRTSIPTVPVVDARLFTSRLGYFNSISETLKNVMHKLFF